MLMEIQLQVGYRNGDQNPGRNTRDKGLQIRNCKAAVISGLLNILPFTKCIAFRTGTYYCNVYLASQTVTEIKKW